MKNKEQQEHFLQHGHLINKKIQCNKCETEITMFGSNLENRINKFGTLWNLLDEFKCRACVSASKPKKEKVVKTKKTKKEKVEELKKLEIPKMKFSIPRDVFLKDAPDIIQSMSESGICLSPSYYLDHAKQCEGCTFFNDCKCALKAA
jgi:hypothetical protein